jgi:hypothetical protein
MQVGYSVPGVVTGKPIVIGGSLMAGGHRSRCGVQVQACSPAEDAIQGNAVQGLVMGLLLPRSCMSWALASSRSAMSRVASITSGLDIPKR